MRHRRRAAGSFALNMRSAVAAVAVAGLATAAGFGIACIIPDKGISTIERGTNWCATVDGAQGWTQPGLDDGDGGGSPELEDIRDGNGNWVRGCHCFSKSEADYIAAEILADDFDDPEFVLLVDTLGVAARQECFDRADQLGLTNATCNQAFEALDLSTSQFGFGDPNGCTREAEWAGTGDPAQGTLPEASSVVACVGYECDVDEDFVADLLDDPWMLLQDGSRLTPVSHPVPGFQFSNVESGRLVHTLGFRTNDVVYLVNDLPLTSMDDAVVALAALERETTLHVKLQRNPEGAWKTITLDFNIE